jgi:heme/copper-type cytochrome/quinol oxidase subunit 2
MKKPILSLLSLALAIPALAERVTLPAAASVVGVAPFFSDVRLFNTSYTSSLTVTAIYRCFIGTCSSAPQTITLAPRQAMPFNDICVSLFSAPNSAGAVEFDTSGSEDDLVVTSRLYSTSPTPTVGMFIPGVRNSEAHAVTVLTSVSNAGAGAGFRANVGAFNPEDAAVTATFRIFDGGAQVGSAVDRALPAHTGTQINNIFGVAGVGGLATTNAVVVVQATGEIFTYAAVIDNTTTDPIFVLGAEDRAAPAVTPPASQTINVDATRFSFTPGTNSPIQVTAGTETTLVIEALDVSHGFSGVAELGLPGGNASPGTPDDGYGGGGPPRVYRQKFTAPASARGKTFTFRCNLEPACGTGHDGMIGSLRVN